ncbi:MAG: bifunctional lysine ketoglutarate reductase /saccharopine dehydrogenase family protein [Candidatus Aminicenantes bacterium]|nr:bifunctional lysine ketoglutarate reductase /saccharopine dehydrogenase family protein [Candidatus Aminicenantes bacterium]
MTLRIGLRREEKILREKRAPLIPSHVRELIASHGLDIGVQSSSGRIFGDEDYRREGAGVEDNLSDCDIIIGLKEIPPSQILPGKVYLFFSHTAKGQPQNMPMLQRLVDQGCTLIDYEKIVDSQGRRMVFFGKQAGLAGMIDSLWALGQRLRLEGIPSPFSRIRQALRYESLVAAKEAVEKAGWDIKNKGLAPGLAPLVCGITGYGHTSQGAQEILELLPVERIKPLDLAGLFKMKNYSASRIYLAVFKEEDMVESRKSSGPFAVQDYYDHPERYRSRLSRSLPYLTLLINCIFWSPQYPKFVTRAALEKMYSGPKPPRLKVIGDISCDINGSIESTVKPTHPQNPVYVFDPKRGKTHDGFKGRGPVVLAVYNLPAEIPLESSVYFSQILKDFVPALAAADFGRDFENCRLPEPLRKAVILFKGRFTPDYLYMRSFVR